VNFSKWISLISLTFVLLSRQLAPGISRELVKRLSAAQVAMMMGLFAADDFRLPGALPVITAIVFLFIVICR